MSLSKNKDAQKYFIQEKITFQGRTEQLDWKKIASINIDSLIHEGDTSLLLELIKPVTFCKADTEFDDERIRIDPAFIKVFRISQLISEFLLASQEKCIEKLTNLQVKYNEMEKEKEKLSEEILHLKETLTSAKKELRKRKEMLATTQNEMLGENNGDEYDQCPYCSKKFLGPGYLLAHIQRRHQGLPVNPIYPPFPSGSATVVCHHSHPQTPHTSHHLHPQQQGLSNGVYDSNFTIPQSSHHVQTMMSHQLFPAVHTPSPSALYAGNPLHPSNLSFSGSVTSLNNLPCNQNQGASHIINAIGLGLTKRESSTQTGDGGNSAEVKHSLHLDLLPEERQHSHNLQHNETNYISDKHSLDFMNRLPHAVNRDSALPTETLMPLVQPQTPVDGFHPTADNGGGDAGIVNTSTLLRIGERVEATKVDVLRLTNQHEEHWCNLEEEKVGQNGTDEEKNDMISKTIKGALRFPINSSQSHLREDGEVTKAPADVIKHPQFVGNSQNGTKGKEFTDFQTLLQASVQGEFKSLISRLESQEQFWQDKLASLHQDYERQIQQLRQELQIQNGTSRNNNNRPGLDEQRVVMVNDKVQLEHKIGDEVQDRGNFMDESSGNVPPPTGIILVGPKTGGGGHHLPQRSHHQQFGTPYGALRDAMDGDANNDKDGGENGGVPVAKPRKSKIVAERKVTTHSFSRIEHMSSVAPSPISANVHLFYPIIQHHQQSSLEQQQQKYKQCQRESLDGRGTLAQLQSHSESDPDFLTIIQPEEFHEGKHDNSMLPNSSDGSATSVTTNSTVAVNHNRSQKQYQLPLNSRTPPPASGFIAGMNKSGSRRGEEEEMDFTGTEVKSDDVSDYTLSESVEVGDDKQNNDICAVSSHENHRQYEDKEECQDHREFADHSRGKSLLKQAPAKKKYIFDPDARKILELSPDDDTYDEDDNESEHNNGDLNSINSSCSSSSAAEDHSEQRKSKSQLDLVRAKTIMELEQNMSNIGLNPESTAIGMEEMKRALKHFKSQQRAAPEDQTHDYDRLEEERNAVKRLAKFEATKSSIDERLDAISTLSTKKSRRSPFVKMFAAVKSSGKNFGKRVASVVKKKHKSGRGSTLRTVQSAGLLTNAKSSGFITTENHVKRNEDMTSEEEIEGKYASGKANKVTTEGKRWKNEMSDTRLMEIKQYVSKSKKEVTHDEETSFSEDDSGEEEFGTRLECGEKEAKPTHFEESKQNYPLERKLAFIQNNTGSSENSTLTSEHSNSKVQQGWASSSSTNIQEEKHVQLRLQRLESPASSHYISPGQGIPSMQNRPKAALTELSTRKRFQLTTNDDESELSNDNMLQNTIGNNDAPIFTKQSGNNHFLTSTPMRKTTTQKESGQRETPSRQMMVNSFDDMNDLDDLLNATLSEDEQTEGKQTMNEIGTDRNSQSTLALSSYKRKIPSSFMIMQPTNHHLSAFGTANLRSKAETQNKLLHNKGGESPGSYNSWDSRKQAL